MNYDFSQISYNVFESLSIDLLSSYFNIHIEKFKIGKDDGIDGRFYNEKGKPTIIQAKHYYKTGFKGLIKKLKEEKSKIDKIKCDRYILTTSVGLSPQNKQEIINTMSPYIRSSGDIFGMDDMNTLLLKNKDIETQYYQLWLPSTNILQSIINNGIIGRNESYIENLQEKSHKYIITESHNKAIEILQEKSCLIITGNPGIGKTTLAENLCLILTGKNGYQFCCINEILEGESIWTKEKKQLFYYDDFLGANFLEAIQNNKDSHIIRFIQRIKNDPTKLFILTSRSNILQQGLTASEIFRNKNIKVNEIKLEITQLSNIDKANILYNHIYFSGLNEGQIEEIYKDKKYHIIINHKNFNPRLIEFITDKDNLDGLQDKQYWDFIISSLDNPQNIREGYFCNQLDDYQRRLIYSVVFNGGKIIEEELQTSFSKGNISNYSNTEKTFNKNIKILTGSILNRNINHKGEITYDTSNPGVNDYILNKEKNNIGLLEKIFTSLLTVESLNYLYDLKNKSLISQRNYNRILENLLIKRSENYNTSNIEYGIQISYLAGDKRNKEIVSFLNLILEEGLCFKTSYINRFITLIDLHFEALIENDYNTIYLSLLAGDKINIEDIGSIMNLVTRYNIENDSLVDYLNEIIKQKIIDQIYQDAPEYYEYIDVTHYEYSEDNIDIGMLIEKIYEDFLINNPDSNIQSRIDTYDLVESIGKEINDDEIIIDYRNYTKDYDDDLRKDYEINNNQYNEKEIIDDIFQRD